MRSQLLSRSVWRLVMAGAFVSGIQLEPFGLTHAAESDGIYEGVVESADYTSIVGWAWDRSVPNKSIEVQILDGATVVGTVKADRPRDDLREAGKGNGRHGFNLPTPNSVKDGKAHMISARAVGTRVKLQKEPVPLTLPKLDPRAMYTVFKSATFTVSAGRHRISLHGLNPGGGDNTVLIDHLVADPEVPIGDAGFEYPSVGTGDMAFRYAPGGSPWTFSAKDAGVTGNSSAFTNENPVAPDGDQVAFLQKRGWISQPANFARGTYTISVTAAQRGNIPSRQAFEVLVDDKVVGTFTPTGQMQKPKHGE